MAGLTKPDSINGFHCREIISLLIRPGLLKFVGQDYKRFQNLIFLIA
jgi:hypothetical protein